MMKALDDGVARVLATLLSAAGAPPSPDLDGIELLPHLRGDTGTAERTVFWRSTRWGVPHALRQGDWKYLRIDSRHPRGTRTETGERPFDLKNDPQERTNLASSRPDLVKHLRDLYDEWNAEVLPAIEPAPPPKKPAATP